MISIEKLCSGMYSDILDSMGYRNQVITGWFANNKPFRMMGYARTLQLVSMDTDDERIDVGLTFVGDVKEGEILVVEGSPDFAYFGEMMTRLSLRQGIGGVVIDGLTRDTVYTHDRCPLNILARGYSPVDIKGRGRVESTDGSIMIGGHPLSSGDLLFADSDALVIIPTAIIDAVQMEIEMVVKEEERIISLIDQQVSIPEILTSVKAF